MSSSFLRAITSLFRRSPRRFAALYQRVNWKQLEAALHYRPFNKDYFIIALMHRSFLATTEGNHLRSNERMEFLGDALLDFVVGEYLFKTFPQKEEGDLTVLRSKLVNKKAVVYFAKEINLRRFILMNAASSGVAEKGFETIIGDAYEAVIAAIYLDSGLPEAKAFILRQLLPALENGFLTETDKNYKSELLELSQALGKGVPRYNTIKEEGPDHDRTFTIEVIINEMPYGTGIGKNKKQAEQSAAQIAVEKLQETNQQ
ncbi:MAG: ribonuclease III [Bacteroidetes bacterium]|nr:ribonuclease III [Bacteroidota bacterium]